VTAPSPSLKIDGLTIPASESSATSPKYHFDIHQPGKPPMEFQAKSVAFRVNGQEIVAGKGTITVDGESFGTIANGDRIAIHPDGRIDVNGVLRSRFDERPEIP
jgi:filamentous hemagglutinin family protein